MGREIWRAWWLKLNWAESPTCVQIQHPFRSGQGQHVRKLRQYAIEISSSSCGVYCEFCQVDYDRRPRIKRRYIATLLLGCCWKQNMSIPLPIISHRCSSGKDATRSIHTAMLRHANWNFVISDVLCPLLRALPIIPSALPCSVFFVQP